MKKLSFKDILNSPEAKSGKYKAIVKELADGRRMFLGLERTSKRSRKYRTKLMCDSPIFLDNKNAEKNAPESGQPGASSAPVVLTDTPAAENNLPIG
jgi:hypothetical protein